MSSRVLGRIRGVLLDLSGTLHVESTPTPSAVAALDRLRDTGVAIRFITNTTKESKRILVSRLVEMGFKVSPQQIFTSLTAARTLVEREGLTPYLMLEDSAMEDFTGLDCDGAKANAVVVGLAPSVFDYHHLNIAFRHLLDGAKLIAIHRSKYYKRSDGLALGPGPFVAGLEYASGVTAQCVGKPEPTFYRTVLEDIGCRAEETVMIGDDIINDVEGAQNVGMRGILVKTGKYREDDEDQIHPAPWRVCDNFAEAVPELISEIMNNKEIFL